MAAVLIGTFEPGSEPWHAARKSGLGGSEIGAVIGLSPFESRFSLWHRKAGHTAPIDELPEIEWGKRLEPIILAKYRELHPDLDYTVRNGTFCAEDRPWQIANPDLLADRIIEAKFSMFGDGWGEPGTDEIPPHVRCQVLWYMDVVGLAEADVCVLVGGCDFREYSIVYDATEAAELRDAAQEFLATIEQGQRPDIDEHSATYQAVKELHPDIDGTAVDVDNTTARNFITTKAAEKAAKDAARQATAVLADVMGDAQRAEWDGQVIARRQVRGDGLPYVVAARSLPDLSELEEAAA